MITIPNLEHSQERGRMPLDIYAHTQRRLSLNSCSQILARQLSSLTSTPALHQVARLGQARPCLVCACQHLDVPGQRLATPGQARQHLDHGWTTSGQRLEYACATVSAKRS